MTGRFSGKSAIVTGGASGIGAATARRLAAEGAAVLVTDISDAQGEHIVSQITTQGGVASYLHCDVASEADWRAAAAEATTRWGRLDYVHNNAAESVVAPTDQLDERDWQRVLDVCLTQVFLSVRACIHHLVEARGGIVNTSSVQAVVHGPTAAAYDSAKGGMLSLTRSLAVAYGPAVRVNAILPGAILTPSWDPYPAELQTLRARESCLKRMGSPEEIASVVAFLLSDEAAFVTGQAITVDGGWTITRSHEHSEA